MNARIEKILAVALAPEELVTACGGRIARAVVEGHAVRVALPAAGGSEASAEALDGTALAPEALRRLGVSEIFTLAGADGAERRVDALRRILEAWSPDRVLVPVHAGNAPFVFALRLALARSASEAVLEAAELDDPLPVTSTERLGEEAARKAEAAALVGGADGGAARLRAVRGEDTESFRRIPAAGRDRDILWSWLAGVGPAERSAEPPVASVIVRTRNRPDLLGDALESLRAQTFRPFEVVLVNDGGADVSAVVAAVRDLDVVIVNTSGVGRSGALNRGIAAAKGRYLAFLDDDDLFFPHHLETAVRFLEANREFAGAYGDVEVAEIESEASGAARVRRRHAPFAQDFDRDLLLFGNYVPIIALVLRREAAERAGPFREDLDLLEDWDFLIRVSREHTLRRIPLVSAEYRVRLEGTNQTRLHPWGSLDESLARIDVARRHFAALTPEAVVRAYRVLMERSFRADGDLRGARAEVETLRKRLAELPAEVEARAESLRAKDAEAIRRLEAECDLLSTELVRRGEALQAQAGALHRLGAEIERLSGSALAATREVGGLHREVERREDLIQAMRTTRLWRVRDWLRGLARARA